MPALLEFALKLRSAGMSPIPVILDGTKRPATSWKPFQSRIATEDELHTWFSDNRYGLGVVTGAVSGNLVMIEIEGGHDDIIHTIIDLTETSGLADIWLKAQGWVEESPSGGLHWFVRVNSKAPANQKLAQTANRHVIAETRGEGGYTVLAPTPGSGHATGNPWQLLRGGPEHVPTLTHDEFTALLACFEAVTEYEEPVSMPAWLETHAEYRPEDGLRPGDDYNRTASWDDILTPRGWRKLGSLTSGGVAWKRPGKTDPGLSATTGRNEHDRLYVFTTSTEFEAGRAYTKFAAHALLEHGGDYSKAAHALAGAGYGEQKKIPVPTQTGATVTDILKRDTPTNQTGTHGALAQTAHVSHLADKRQEKERLTLTGTDDSNAIQLVNTWGDRIRYCSDRGRWLVWNGHRWDWQPLSGGIIREYAKQIARALPDGDKAEYNHKRRSLSAKGTTDMITQAATDHRITVTMNDLDAHPWELNTPGGIVDLHTGTLHAPDPTKLHTRTTTVTPDTNMDAGMWLDFLNLTFAHDTHVLNWVQRLAGYSTIGEVREHILPFAFGSGGNGKGVFLESIRGVLGDYATTSPSGFLMATNYTQHSTEIARLSGARFVICSEVNEADRFDEAKVKLLTGGDTLTARFMRQDDFTFTPTHHLWLMGNFKPDVQSGGSSFWRRARVIPFIHEVPEDQRIDDLQNRLIRESGPAILAWIIAGAAMYAQQGLKEPDSIAEETRQYASDVDVVGRFLDECCYIPKSTSIVAKSKQTARVNDVYHAFEQWCIANGETRLSVRSFSQRLKQHGVLVGRDAPRAGNGGARVYGGISLKSPYSGQGVTQDDD